MPSGTSPSATIVSPKPNRRSWKSRLDELPERRLEPGEERQALEDGVTVVGERRSQHVRTRGSCPGPALSSASSSSSAAAVGPKRLVLE